MYSKDSDNVVLKLDKIFVKKDSSTVEKIHQTVNYCTIYRLIFINSYMAIINNIFIDQGTDFTMTVDVQNALWKCT